MLPFNQLSVVMITLNEEGAVRKVVAQIQKIVPEAEIVVVDSSTDQTAEIAAEMGCVVVKQFPPRGYGNAMHMALSTASREYVATLDCDDTYPVDALPGMLQKMLDENLDIVSASRLGKRPDTMPFENYLANVAFCIIGRMITGVASTDLHTGMRIYRRGLLNSYPYDPSYAALPVELQIGPVMIGYRCKEIYIDYLEREGVSKLRKIEGTIATLKRLWHCRWFFNPFRSKLIKERKELMLKSKAGAQSS